MKTSKIQELIEHYSQETDHLAGEINGYSPDEARERRALVALATEELEAIRELDRERQQTLEETYNRMMNQMGQR